MCPSLSEDLPKVLIGQDCVSWPPLAAEDSGMWEHTLAYHWGQRMKISLEREMGDNSCMCCGGSPQLTWAALEALCIFSLSFLICPCLAQFPKLILFFSPPFRVLGQVRNLEASLKRRSCRTPANRSCRMPSCALCSRSPRRVGGGKPEPAAPRAAPSGAWGS